MRNRFAKIKISDYQKSSDKDLEEWLIVNEAIPDYFWDKLKKIDPDTTIQDLLTIILKELYTIYGNKRDKAESLADSRFTPLSEMLERGMISCGSLVNIFGMVLRKFRIPVRFVHGKLKKQNRENRHAWLEILDPLKKQWIEMDPTTENFEILPEARKVKIYRNWNEMKEDYEKRNF